jgi:acyl-CoA thioesterase
MAGMELPELLHSLAPERGGGFSAEVPEDWSQGRTVFGGLNAALAVRSARQLEAELGPLRAVQIAFIAPALGRLTYLPTVLRQGRSVTFVGVDCRVAGGLAARAILTFGRPRETELRQSEIAAPTAPAPADCPEVSLTPGVTPAFLANLELRFATGSPPLSGGRPDFSMWVRHRRTAGLDRESAAIAVADVLPPAVVASRAEFRPASSVTWTVDLVDPLPTADGWYLLRTASDLAADGYSLQAMSCFDATGAPVALGRQTLAYF